MTARRPRGFTLIELLIAVAIVAILARLATPSYRNYIIRANRADAQQTLLRAAQGMERYAITNGANGYSGASLGTLAVTTSVTQSPSTGSAVYNIAFSGTPTITAFVIKATPVTTGLNKNDDYLTIDNTGARKWGATKTWTSR